MQTIQNINFSQAQAKTSPHALIWEKLSLHANQEAGDWKWRAPFFEAAKAQGLPKATPQGAYAGVKLSALFKHLEEITPVKAEPISAAGPYDIIFSAGKLVQKPTWPCMSLEQVARHPVAQQRYKAWLQNEKDSFALLNAALSQEALFCRLPEDFQGKIRILFDAGHQQMLASSRLTLWAPAGSRVEIECVSTQQDSQACLELIDLVLEEESHVEMSWQRASCGFNLAFLRASLMKQAKLHFIDLSEGSSISRLDAQVKLMQEGSFADLRGLALLSNQSQNQTHVRIEHVAASCESSQLFKVMLKDRARSHFQGKIYVFPQAQKTQAYQLNRNLLLSEGAQAQSCPNLEIFADDVKASHGSTTGPVDPESLFYLLSRGIDQESATGLLAHGFALDVLSSMKQGELFERWKKKVMAI